MLWEEIKKAGKPFPAEKDIRKVNQTNMPMYLYADIRCMNIEDTAFLPTRFSIIFNIVHSVPFILPVPFRH